MKFPNRISASILSADFSCLRNQIEIAESAGIDWIHIDVMDGAFVPNISMGPFIVETCRKISSLPLDVHLMIDRPDRYLQAFAAAGASNLSVHIENNPHIHRTIQTIKSMGCKAGVVLNPGTPTNAIQEVLEDVDFILVMTVNPGYSGQKFIPQAAKKISQIRQSLDLVGKQDTEIEVDGGISPETLPLVQSLGANIFVAASAIFKYPQGIRAGVSALKAAIPN